MNKKMIRYDSATVIMSRKEIEDAFKALFMEWYLETVLFGSIEHFNDINELTSHVMHHGEDIRVNPTPDHFKINPDIFSNRELLQISKVLSLIKIFHDKEAKYKLMDTHGILPGTHATAFANKDITSYQQLIEMVSYITQQEYTQQDRYKILSSAPERLNESPISQKQELLELLTKILNPEEKSFYENLIVYSDDIEQEFVPFDVYCEEQNIIFRRAGFVEDISDEQWEAAKKEHLLSSENLMDGLFRISGGKPIDHVLTNEISCAKASIYLKEQKKISQAKENILTDLIGETCSKHRIVFRMEYHYNRELIEDVSDSQWVNTCKQFQQKWEMADRQAIILRQQSGKVVDYFIVNISGRDQQHQEQEAQMSKRLQELLEGYDFNKPN